MSELSVLMRFQGPQPGCVKPSHIYLCH